MSHPDPLFDPDNSYEDDDMLYDSTNEGWNEEYGMGNDYDDHEDFHEQIVEHYDENYGEDYDDSMDGDHDSAMTSCGWGTDEDYGYFGENDDDSFYGEDY